MSGYQKNIVWVTGYSSMSGYQGAFFYSIPGCQKDTLSCQGIRMTPLIVVVSEGYSSMSGKKEILFHVRVSGSVSRYCHESKLSEWLSSMSG
jgi:hypothetical protein